MGSIGLEQYYAARWEREHPPARWGIVANALLWLLYLAWWPLELLGVWGVFDCWLDDHGFRDEPDIEP